MYKTEYFTNIFEKLKITMSYIDNDLPYNKN